MKGRVYVGMGDVCGGGADRGKAGHIFILHRKSQQRIPKQKIEKERYNHTT